MLFFMPWVAKAKDGMARFTFEEDTDTKKYNIVKGKLDSNFIAKKNVIYETAKFNQCMQCQDESLENLWFLWNKSETAP